MTLIVETGLEVAGAESYISVTDSDTYHSDRGNTTWATLTTAVKEQNLRKATEYMLQIYRERWKGVRMTSTQSLDWPRGYVYLEPVITGASQEFPNLVADNIVPTEVKRACAELALKSYASELSPDLDRLTNREKLGPMEVEYSDKSAAYKKYRAIDNMLAPYLESTGGVFKQLVRV